jgi:hypothetical protein
MRRDTIFWGSLLVLLGILFLLNNAGLLGSLDIWGLFWPFFLIFLGVWILLSYFLRTKPEEELLKVPVEGADHASIRFDHGVGRLIVKAGRNQEELLSGTFGGGVEFSRELSGGQANISLKKPPRWFTFRLPGNMSAITWNVDLKPDFPLTLNFNTGAGDTSLELSDLQVKKVVLKTGASATRIMLPISAGYTSMHVEAGVASVDIHVPPPVAARIRAEVGLGSLSIDGERFPKQGGIYISKDYESAENKVDIDISSGVSSVSVN